MKIRYQHMCKETVIEWTEIGHGKIFQKFTAKDEGTHGPNVELHGLVDEQGNFYILREIVYATDDAKESADDTKESP